jgi:salicylate hydroxylase
MLSRDRIVVVGAGLGGLTTALALAQRGHSVMVMEQASRLAEVGAGLTLSSGAMRCLELLGLAEEVAQHSSLSSNVSFVHYRSGELLRSGLDSRQPRPSSARTARQIHRADLHSILQRALLALAPNAIVTNWQFAGYQCHNGGIEACAVNGARISGSLLLGCDGVRSAVRTALLGDQPVEFLGQVAFRCLVPMERALPLVASKQGRVFLGPGRTFNRYPLRDSTLMNCVGLARTDQWRAEGWNTPATAAEFLAHFADWHPEVTGLIRAAPPSGIIKWALCGREPLPAWQRGPVALLGDAAHPLLPFLGLGAAMAIEDAVILARALSTYSNPEAALCAYEAARKPRADRVARASAWQGELSQQMDPEQYKGSLSPAHDPEYFDYDPDAVSL